MICFCKFPFWTASLRQSRFCGNKGLFLSELLNQLRMENKSKNSIVVAKIVIIY